MKTKPEESMFLTAKILKLPEVFRGNSEVPLETWRLMLLIPLGSPCTVFPCTQ